MVVVSYICCFYVLETFICRNSDFDEFDFLINFKLYVISNAEVCSLCIFFISKCALVLHRTNYD